MDRAILDKIRKCLALGRSANEHEAAAALSKAAALMAEYGVTDAMITLADIEEATARASRTQRPPQWETLLARTVCRALSVECFVDGVGDRTFVGRGAAAEIAGYAFAVLFRQLKAARAKYIASHLKRCKPGRKRQRADVYCLAWAYSVHEKVAALAPEVADQLIGQYLAERHPGLADIRARTPQLKGGGVNGDVMRGMVAGRAVDLNAGVGGAERLALT